jgi:hypothetical protein
MDIRAEGYLDRAEKELVLSHANYELSNDAGLKRNLGIPSNMTFYNNVISGSYYAIFILQKHILVVRIYLLKRPKSIRRHMTISKSL